MTDCESQQTRITRSGLVVKKTFRVDSDKTLRTASGYSALRGDSNNAFRVDSHNNSSKVDDNLVDFA